MGLLQALQQLYGQGYAMPSQQPGFGVMTPPGLPQAQQLPLAQRPAVSPMASLTAPPSGQPVFGADMSQPGFLPPGGAAKLDPSGKPPYMKDTTPSPGQGGWMGGFGKGLNSAIESPLFQLGMSLMGNATSPEQWGGVGRDLRSFQQDRREQQQQDNETRRDKSRDQMAQTQFGWATTEHDRTLQERQALDAWVGTLPADQQTAARANPEVAYQAFMEARAAANAPITPYQQAQLDVETRGQNLSHDAQMANINRDRPLRGPDASLLQSVRETADRASSLAQYGAEFMRLNGPGGTGTGPERAFNPLNNFDSGYQTLNALSSNMIPFQRVPGSGATSDYEQQLYQRGVQSPTNSPQANQAIYRNQQTLASLAQQRRYFYEDWASRNGSLNGAEEAFRRSPEFQAIQRANPLRAAPPAGGARGEQPSTGATRPVPPAAAIADLRRDSSAQARQEFDAIFGPGAAARALAGQPNIYGGPSGAQRRG